MLSCINEKGFVSCELSTTEPHGLALPSSPGPQLPFSPNTKVAFHPCPNVFSTSGNFPTLLKLAEPAYSTCNLPDFPLFVVIITAPLPAAEPYNDEAAVPFRTVILSISLGFRSLAPLPKSFCAVKPAALEPGRALSIGTPSITYSG